MSEITDAQIMDAKQTEQAQQLAVQRHKPQSSPVAMTSTQARIEAVAELTRTAMARAGTLQLTPDESKALLADFADEDFQPGAAGKENLLYLEHAALRDRFNSVLGLGQWAIIVRETWNEEFRTAKGTTGVKVYARAMLLVRGCYVAEAVGDMDYFTGNAAQNYGDAFEGAKTAAFRRCAKEFGIGLQAWRKEWCLGWWTRKRGASNFRQPKPVETREAAGAGNVATPAATVQHTDDQRARFLQVITELLPESEKLAADYGWISPEHGLSSIAWSVVPTLTKSYVDGFRAECAKLKMQPPKTSDKTVARPPDWFWGVAVTVPRAGMKKKEYLQAPDTIRSLYDAGKGGDDAARKRLFGLAKEWAPKAYEYQGKTYEPSKEDRVCRDALDAFCEFEEQNSDDVKF